jgi:hypothetical protein
VESPLQFLQEKEPHTMMLLGPGVVGKLHASAAAGAPELWCLALLLVFGMSTQRCGLLTSLQSPGVVVQASHLHWIFFNKTSINFFNKTGNIASFY